MEHAHTETLLAHCSFQAQCLNKVTHLDRSPENMLITFLVLCFTRTLRKGTINVGNYHTCTVQLYGGVPLTLPAVTCRTYHSRTCEKYRNVPLH